MTRIGNILATSI